jgi:transposase
MKNKIDCSPETKEYAPYLRVKKINGNLYLYETTDHYNPVTKRKKQSSRYIRKILSHEDLDHLTKEPPPSPIEVPKLKQIVSYGDAYLFSQLVEEIGLQKILLKCFSAEETNLLLLLVAYRLLEKQSISHLSSWMETTDLKTLYPYEKSLSSHAISNALSNIGETAEETIPHFLLHWSQKINKEGDSLLFDITSFTSQAKRMEELEIGYAKDHSPYPQINVGVLVNQEQHLPLYYKIYPGSLKDVSLLSNMVEEASLLGIPSIHFILDRGFYSGYNLGKLHAEKHSFLLPLPRTAKKLYRQIVTREEPLESPDHLFLWKGKPLYAVTGYMEYPCLRSVSSQPTTKKKKEEAEAEENHPTSTTFPLFYGLYLDPQRKQQEETAFLTDLLYVEEALQDIEWSLISTKKKRDEIWKETTGKWESYFTLQHTKNTFQVCKNAQAMKETTQYFGVMILLSSTPSDGKTLLEQYKQREAVEKLFDAGKNELQFQPLRVHSSNTMKSILFVLFLSLIVQTYLLGKMKTGQVDTKYSIHSVFFELHKLKKAIWKGQVCIINEITKTQRLLFKQLKVFLPKFAGN